MSNNLLKAWAVSPNPEEVRIIDSDSMIAKRLEWPSGHSGSQQAKQEEFGQTAEDADGSAADLLCSEEGAAGGFREGLNAEAVEVYEGPGPEEIIEQAKDEVRRIIEEAQAQAGNIRQSASEEGWQQGYAAGMQEAQEKCRAEEQRLQELQAKLEREYWEKVDELEPEFVDVLTGIYEHIFKVKLGAQRDFILNLLTEAMHGIEGCKSFIVHVSPEEFADVKEAKLKLKEAAMSPEASVEVIEDVTLSENECLIETDSGIYDCSLDTQLKELTRQLRLLSYERQ